MAFIGTEIEKEMDDFLEEKIREKIFASKGHAIKRALQLLKDMYEKKGDKHGVGS